MEYVYKFEMKDIGIVIGVRSYYLGDGGNINGHPDTWYPPEPPEIDWCIIEYPKGFDIKEWEENHERDIEEWLIKQIKKKHKEQKSEETYDRKIC